MIIVVWKHIKFNYCTDIICIQNNVVTVHELLYYVVIHYQVLCGIICMCIVCMCVYYRYILYIVFI